MTTTKNGPAKNGTPKAAPQEQATDKTKPIHEIRLGRIRAAIWLNEGENGTWYNAQITRLYKDRNDQWKDSTGFGREDLPLVAKIADLAMTWMFEHPVSSEK
jgi:hypothetical protein